MTEEAATVEESSIQPDPPAEVEGQEEEQAEASSDETGEDPSVQQPPEPDPTTPEGRAQLRLQRAAQAEAARSERTEVSTRLDRAEGILGELQRYESGLAAREREIRAAYREMEALRERVRAGGPEALEALGITYADWTSAELEKSDPQYLAKKALEENKRLRQELAERERRQEQARRQEDLDRQVQQEQAALIEHASEAASPQVAQLARAAQTNPRARRFLVQAADEVAAYHIEQTGSVPKLGTVIRDLDKYLDFLQAQEDAAQARAPVPAQATRPANTRTLGNPGMSDRAAPRRQLSEEEQRARELASLREAMSKDGMRFG